MTVDLSVSYRAPATARAMAEAASRFVDSLNEAQRAAATFPFAGDERYEWEYRPKVRNGLRLMSMTREQQRLALALVDSGMSERAVALLPRRQPVASPLRAARRPACPARRGRPAAGTRPEPRRRRPREGRLQPNRTA